MAEEPGATPGPGKQHDRLTRQALEHDLQRVRELAQQVQAGQQSAEVQRRGPFDDLRRRDLEQDIDLKWNYASWLKWVLIGQLVIADAFVVAYAWVGRGWDVPSTVIHSWLAATVIQIVGVVLVVTRYLFPRR